MKPEALRPATYAKRYFGPGPDPAGAGPGPSAWAGAVAGATGGVLLAVAYVLWRARRVR
jgi:membrane associated rhomboid family serine protease